MPDATAARLPLDPLPAPTEAKTAAPAATLANVNLFVRDPARARRFYVEALGLADDARSAPPHFLLLDAGGGCTLTLQAADAVGEPLGPGAGPNEFVELGFELAADVQGAAAALAAAGARVTAAGGTATPAQVMGWARGFDGRDPDGHRLTVFVRSPDGRPSGDRPARPR